MMADSPITEAGPLAGWLTAVIIAFGRLTGLMGDIAAVRFAACLLFALTTAALWYGTWHLARRPEAQPIGLRLRAARRVLATTAASSPTSPYCSSSQPSASSPANTRRFPTRRSSRWPR